MTELHKSKPFVWALFLVFCILWFYALDVRTLVPTDEGRYAEMAREMLATGDWVTLRLNGIKYFEKPPLQTWMNALTFAAFGLGDWQARLWTGLTGLFGILMTGYTGLRLYGARVGFNTAVVLASSFMWAALGHVNTLDMGLSGMMTLALCALLLAQRDGASAREQRNWMLACWAGMALAVLSKGLIGVVLPGAVLVLYTVFSRDWAIWKRLHLVAGLLLFFAISAPWFILISLKNPEFPYFFFVHEHFQRFTTKVHHRYGPWYYFIPILAIGLVPWLPLLPQSLWNARRKAGSRFQPQLMLAVWAIFIFVFFSISDSKLPSYILPIAPALALLIALQLERASALAIALCGALLAIAGAAGLAFAHRIPALARGAFETPLYQAYVPWALAAGVAALAGGLLTVALARRRREAAVLLLAIAGYLGGQILMVGHEPLGRYKAGLDLVPAIQAELGPDTPIYAVDTYEQALPFYLRHELILVEGADEMAFGVQQEPQLWLPTRAAFIDKWNADRANGKKDLAILPPQVYAELQERNLPMRVVVQDPRRVIVANDARKQGKQEQP